MEKTYKGSCFCGAVSLLVTGEPVTMGYCHCESCRHWSAGPVNAYTLWRPGAVKITSAVLPANSLPSSDEPAWTMTG